MRHRTKMFTAAAAAAAALAGSTAAATLPAAAASASPSASASPPAGGKPCIAVKSPGKPAPGNAAQQADFVKQLAGQLGVSTERLDQALRATKMSMATSGKTPTQQQFDATLAHFLGISLGKVQQAFPEAARGSKSVKVPVSQSPGAASAGGKSPGAQSPGAQSPGPGLRCGTLPPGKVRVPQQSPAQVQAAMAAAVAKSLHVSTARVESALATLFAAGRADPSSPAFAAAARSLGVSTAQLASAIEQAKQSLASAG
jgi:hypothetical protein